mmetsp:Transcript_15480/g.34784  ORF Transcript_15480/g.34784 Transcript_15480/m.34784 type:complete len:203 (+) Transcript_15480:540-1148(+)
MACLPHECTTYHLFKLPTPKNKITGCDFIPKGFPYLCHAEGNLAPRRPHGILKVDEDALSRLRPQIRYGGRVAHGPHVGLKHEVEISGHGQCGLSAAGGGNFAHLVLCCLREVLESEGLVGSTSFVGRLEKLLGLFLGGLDHVGVVALLDADIADGLSRVREDDGGEEELVSAVAEFRLLTVHHGVRKSIEVACYLRVVGIE